MSDCFIGEIRMFAGNYSPENWATCSGQSMSISQYQALFSLMGVTYGGDGVNTFNLPDLRGRVPIGQGTDLTANPPLGPWIIGRKGGEEEHILTVAEMAPHTHLFNVVDANATSQIPGPGMTYGKVEGNVDVYGLYSDTAPTTTTTTLVQFDAKAVTFAGGTQGHANMMVTTAISFIMAVQGTYPFKPN